MSALLSHPTHSYVRQVALVALLMISGCSAPTMLGVDDVSDNEAAVQTEQLVVICWLPVKTIAVDSMSILGLTLTPCR